jgi:hypothetical protein
LLVARTEQAILFVCLFLEVPLSGTIFGSILHRVRMNSYNVLDSRSDFFIDDEIKRWMKICSKEWNFVPFIMPDNSSPRRVLPCFSLLALGLTPSWYDLKGCHYPIPKALGG